MTRDAAYFEARYRNGLAVPDRPRLLARWESESARARRELRCELDLRYGPHRLQTLDVYHSRGPCRAVFMFLHGGYWMSFDKQDHGFIALALAERGVTTVLPNYALCPEVGIPEIVRQTEAAAVWLHDHAASLGLPPDALYVSGHSAGGHLTAMLLATDWPAIDARLPPTLIRGGLAISGIYDLREIVEVHSINAKTRLDVASAAAVSPMFLEPASSAPLYLAVGGDELPPFHEQQAELAERWKRVVSGRLVCAGENHYSVLLQFTDPASPLVAMAGEMMGV